ncbi:MAG: hypothetical protein M1820_004409 [Bogoriella megaspora]|nr:MAG: hypothetical protein M1820_004409 [Bogoriella megaspora]
MVDATEIPQPPGWPLIGNALDVSEQGFIARMADQYGPIFKVKLGVGKPYRIHICSAELLDELCDEKRFIKSPQDGGLSEVRNLTGDGLFTAMHGEENWALAHRILMPVLGPMSIGSMFEDMHEVACQLVLKWARVGQHAKIAATEDFTRLTLDTLALCTMDTRFNSFYAEMPHPFVAAMTSFLKESGSRSIRPSFVTDYVYRKRTQQYHEDIELMRDVADQVLQKRRTLPTRKKDLVDAMIYEKDPVSGKTLPESNIINNMITFLIAGHETTSGPLSFLLYLLVKNPGAMKTARDEVLAVLGEGPMTADMTSRLPYVSAVIRETLRLHPTAPAFQVLPKSSSPEDYPILIGQKKYAIHQGDALIATLSRVHRDPVVFGSDADEFRPERMLDEQFNQLPKNSWKSTIVVALLLQNFEFELYDPDYKLAIRKTLTVKPKDFFVRAALREGLNPVILQRRLTGGQPPETRSISRPIGQPQNSNYPSQGDLKDLLICYGSNTGTCPTLAHSLAREALSHGFRSKTITMNESMDQIVQHIPVVIITASYEGCPPDNAGGFVKWLECLTESPFSGHRHAVFGCGNRDWVDTFQRIPTLVDSTFIRCGSTPLVPRGLSDAANNNIFNDFDEWSDILLWPALARQYSTEPQIADKGSEEFQVVQTSRIRELLQDAQQAIVEEARTLTMPSEPQKRHTRTKLPQRMAYAAGDHLAILPVNHDTRVREVMTRFGLAIDSTILSSDGSEKNVYTFLRDYLELNQLATDKNIRAIQQSIPEKPRREAFEQMLAELNGKAYMSALAILQKFPTATLSFQEYLNMLPPIRPRLYSISSSPLAGANTCTLTYSVLNETDVPLDGTQSAYLGTASNYLASLRTGDRLWVALRRSNQAFHLPENQAEMPIVMVCAGSGIAPFLGFIEERAIRMEQGAALARAMIFIGCRHPERDALYARELQMWAMKGAVELRYAFSRAADRSEGCKYVQDRLWKDRASLLPLVKGLGKVFVCGNTRLVDGVSEVVARVYAEEKESSVEEAQLWLRTIRNQAFVVEVFD